MWNRVTAYFRSLINRRRAGREADDELRFHVEMEAEANRARGMASDEARQAALREFGGVTQAREGVRRVRQTWVDGAWQDFRYSIRTLRRTPAFTAMAVVILGLGIGASAAAFSIVNAVFFKPLNVPDRDSLVYVYALTSRGQRHQSFGAQARQFFDGHFDQAFSGITAHYRASVSLGADGESTTIRGEAVESNYFDVIGVSALHGRTFEPRHNDPTNPEGAIVISDTLWKRRFKGDAQILGRSIRLDDRMFTVIGVMPPGFTGLSSAWEPSEFWVTAMQFDEDRPTRYGPSNMGTVARLKPGVGLAQAQAVVDVHGAQLQIDVLRETPFRNWKPTKLVVVPAASVSNPHMPDSWLIDPKILAAISVVVLIVLLIAATNIAGVLAARSVTRAQEIAVRQSLGAGTARLVRQLLIESVTVAIAGGAFGLLLARAIVGAYMAFVPERFFVEVSFDPRVALFTLVVCVVAGLLVGLAPALQTRRVNVVAALAGGTGAGGSRRVRRRLRHAILIPQIALSMVLLVVAGIHLRHLSAIESADPGYRMDDVVVLNASHWDGSSRRYQRLSKDDTAKRAERSREFYRAVFDRVRNVPVDGGVAVSGYFPVRSLSMPGWYVSEAGFRAGRTGAARADAKAVSPGYFRTLGMRLIGGRDFDDRDAMTSKHVAIVSEALAQELWPAGNAIGQRLAWFYPGTPEAPTKGEPKWWLEVIGIVNETSVYPDAGAAPMLYTTLAQASEPGWLSVIASDRGDQAALIARLKAAIVTADDYAEVTSVQSLEQVIGVWLYPRRAAVAILLACGLVGLVLASIGIYGVMSHSVAQRMQEIGIRSTLGADRRAILTLMLKEAAVVTAAGALPGIYLATVAAKLTSNVVGAVPAFDLAVFLVVPLIAMAVILAASFIPARRASRLDPMTVLRGN